MMKKVMSLFVAVLTLILVTGCGSSKTLTCTQTEDGQEIKVVATTNNDDKITKVKMEMTMTAETKEELDAGVAILELSKAAFNEKEGIKMDVKKSGLKATMTVEFDLTKVSKETLEELGFDEFSADLTGAEFKKNSEENGATCK